MVVISIKELYLLKGFGAGGVTNDGRMHNQEQIQSCCACKESKNPRIETRFIQLDPNFGSAEITLYFFSFSHIFHFHTIRELTREGATNGPHEFASAVATLAQLSPPLFLEQ